MRLVYKLLLAKSNPVQLIGFVLANIVGVFILLFGIRAYSDVSATFQDPEGAIANNYLVISRGPVVTGQDNRFTAEELREISQCEGVESIGGFRTANFDLNIDLSALGVNFSSAFFLESIPSQFVDLKLNAWSATVYDDDSYHIDDPTLFVPVILPSAYLKVYNFGLAPGKGLSQLNEAQIKMLVFRMRCHGNGMVHYYKARVVGFTNRINTVLVPEDFLDAANRKYGTVERMPNTVLPASSSNPAARTTRPSSISSATRASSTTERARIPSRSFPWSRASPRPWSCWAWSSACWLSSCWSSASISSSRRTRRRTPR